MKLKSFKSNPKHHFVKQSPQAGGSSPFLLFSVFFLFQFFFNIFLSHQFNTHLTALFTLFSTYVHSTTYTDSSSDRYAVIPVIHPFGPGRNTRTLRSVVQWPVVQLGSFPKSSELHGHSSSVIKPFHSSLLFLSSPQELKTPATISKHFLQTPSASSLSNKKMFSDRKLEKWIENLSWP